MEIVRERIKGLDSWRGKDSLHDSEQPSGHGSAMAEWPRWQISFRQALIGVSVVAAVVSYAAVFIPFEVILEHIHKQTNATIGEAVHEQEVLVDQFARAAMGSSYLGTLSQVEGLVLNHVVRPPDAAVCSMWDNLRASRRFRPSWNGRKPEERAELAYRAWAELSTQRQKGPLGRSTVAYRSWASLTSAQGTASGDLVPDDQGPSGSSAWRDSDEDANVKADVLYVGFLTGEYAGAKFECNGTCLQGGYATGYLFDAPGVANGTSTNRSTWLAHPLSGERVGEPTTQPFLSSNRPWFSVQARIAKFFPTRQAVKAWSPLYKFFDGSLGVTLTLPVAYCGNYTCFEGVMGADITLRTVGRICLSAWLRLKRMLAQEEYSYPIGFANSSIFIVNSQSARDPTQEGVLVGASHVVAMGKSLDQLVNAVDSPQATLSYTAKSILAKFDTWNATELGDTQVFSFSMSAARQGSFEACDPELSPVPNDCFVVATHPVRLDSITRWLVVLAMPGDAFRSTVKAAREEVSYKIANLTAVSEEQISNLRVVGVALLVVLNMMGPICSLAFGIMLSGPLKKLSGLMVQLGELDFQHRSGKFLELRKGLGGRIRETIELQRAFYKLSCSIEAFARFLPDTVVRNIVQGARRATRLHVSKRTVTIMFSDIRDFTTISESLPEHDLLYVLTRYLGVMTRIVKEYQGVVAEILGDGLLVFWNTPDEVEMHAAQACAAALAQQQALVLLNAELAELNLPQLAIRIGLHTGSVLTGNIGSETKMKFGCMGDAVNLASRLEGLCKFYGVGIICSADTYKDLPSNSGFFCRRLDLVQVKGRHKPTCIYELVGRTRGASWEQECPEGLSGDAVAVDMTGGGGTAVHHESVTGRSESALVVKQACSVSIRSLRYCDSELIAEITDKIGQACQLENCKTPATLETAVSVTAARRQQVQQYEEALQAYQEARFAEAKTLTEALLEDIPDDLATLRLHERASKYVGPSGEILPPEDAEWTGVLAMFDK